MIQLVIAEKPSVAQSIAAVLGATSRRSGYLEGGGYIVSWCFGHLVGLAPADQYNERFAKWRHEDLPILPQPWQYTVPERAKKQFDVLHRLLHDEHVEHVICATDAGREGELIFRLVYHQCQCTKPVKRLWISSLEESAIRDGFDSLRDGADFDRLYMAALCRAQADWLVGINATRYFSLIYGLTLNVGRVMSPTLALIVNRETEIADFQPKTFYTVRMSRGFYASSDRLASQEEAERIKAACDYQVATVMRIDRKERSEKPPRLFDLTTLQRTANRLFGFTAQQTLDYAQSLYERKLVTYPRTDSQYLTSDMEESLPTLVQTVAAALPFMEGLDLPIHAEQVIDNARVSDHHALLPTRSLRDYDLSALSAGERSVLYLIVTRLLCAVGDACRWEETNVELDCQGYVFHAKGKSILKMGWKIPEATFQGSMGSTIDTDANKEKDSTLPPLTEGQRLSPVLTMIRAGQTTPPKHYTEDSLLAAMEAAGAEDMPDDAEHRGIGTPATRAGILEKLVNGGFIERVGEKKTKDLLPTSKGTALTLVLPEQLRYPQTTADWEQRLKQIERGEAEPDGFLDDTAAMLCDLFQTYDPVPGAAELFPHIRQKVGMCPSCQMSVSETPKGYFCDNRSCRFSIWKDNRFFTTQGTAPTREIVETLLRDGHARLTGLKSSRTGKVYDATIYMTCGPDGSPRFSMAFDGGDEK